MAVAVRSVAHTGWASSSGNVNIAMPSTIVAGDLLYMFFMTDGGESITPDFITSAAFSDNPYDNNAWLVPSASSTLSALQVAILVATGTGAEASTYPFAVGGSANGVAHVLAISGAQVNNNSGPLDKNHTWTVSGTAGTSHVAPSQTPVNPNCLLLTHFVAAPSLNSSSAYTVPSGMTSQFQGPDSTTSPFYYALTSSQVLSGSGASGTKTATLSTSSQWFAMTSLVMPSVVRAPAGHMVRGGALRKASIY
jgi:hypothetical protein